MADMLIVHNDGPDIRSSTSWQTDMARQGPCCLSTNTDAFRLLVPKTYEGALREMRTATVCVISPGPCPDMGLLDALANEMMCLRLQWIGDIVMVHKR
jgi:hypothetical protein